MPIESCCHGKKTYSDVVLVIKTGANRPVTLEHERLGLASSLQEKGFRADVAVWEDPCNGLLEVRVCRKTRLITQETVKSIETLIRGQGMQILLQ